MTFSLANGELNLSAAPVKQTPKVNHWDKSDLIKLKALYPIHSNKELSKIFNRTEQAIAKRAFKMGIKKDKIFTKTRKVENRFKKGHVPHNKGVKGVRFSPDTEFKQGHQPHNTKYDGAITIRYDGTDEVRKPYYCIRLACGKWEYLHRHIWQQLKGEIPPHYIIRFIDGNTLNIDIDNLMCITRAQNAQLNQNRKKQARSMRRTWAEKKQLKTA